MKGTRMKSKAVQLKPSTAEKQNVNNSYDILEYNNVNKPFDFVGLYKSAAETSKILDKHKLDDRVNKVATNKARSPKRERSPNKNKKRSKQEPLEISQINIDASTLNSGKGASAQVSAPKVTSTPNGSASNQARRVKSIMKHTSLTDQPVDTVRYNVPSGKPKKRNKSVSFMLEDNEEVVVKRTKSDDSIKVNKKAETTKATIKDRKKPIKKSKNEQQSEKENTATNVNKQTMEVDSTPPTVQDKKPAKALKAKKVAEPTVATATTEGEPQNQDKKKKFKKVKKHKPELSPETMETESNNNDVTSETKHKKLKKKKQVKPTTDKLEIGEGDGEPVSKSRKKDPKPDIVDDLENLSIGDNAHTLTNLLDEMTVVDKEKRKKLKHKFNKNKTPKGPNKEETEKPEEVKEKVKWKKRKWNKDKKGELNEESLNTVVIENLPLAIMLNYKKLITDHFVKFGPIKKIGIAEVYPTVESKPVFTTTIQFISDAAAEQALEQNNTEFEGSRIRVKRPLPATVTTVVVRSYAELTDQNISSTFVGAGKIRSIKHLVKGKKSMATAFVEFHGPESVESAIKMAADVKIGGKKMHVAKFEPRLKKKKEKKPKNDGDSAADADSEESND